MYDILLKEIKLYLETSSSFEESLKWICNLLKKRVEKYHWVGYYMNDEKNKRLVLKCFSGKPTSHKIIPYGKGVCGQVANKKKTIIVDDVESEENYISCNIDVKSEIVVPLFLNNIIMGQIDIDSNFPSAFNSHDELFLIEINSLVSKLLEENF
ncbi:MAG: GAF domain-containing protein [Bacteroidota bacterium]|jgi:GAF domain-containing protein|nr:GAF domain-containing protein [Bacteroidota bacterium]MEC9160875.1 GAF domain-containing protein [Bacteroidota bacterium]|tara:strand:- start:9511 stop:9972 length:462 start_codon:yes stop_codon:yes gene_type:complete